jgi:phosphonoacetate hydrolase
MSMPLTPDEIRSLRGVTSLKRFELPLDREADFVAISERDAVIGATRAEHVVDFGARLRSHGGTSEQAVPLIISRPLNRKYQQIAKDRRLRNFDVFKLALNGVEATAED